MHGVGFDVSFDSVSVAVSFSNGSVVDVAQISATTELRRLIKDLSSPQSQHPACVTFSYPSTSLLILLRSPYMNQTDYVRDLPRQAIRRLRKSMGLPASPKLAILAKIIVRLQEVVEETLTCSLQAATLSVPNLYGLYREDISDLFEYLRLREIYNTHDYDNDPLVGVIHQSLALIAGKHLNV